MKSSQGIPLEEDSSMVLQRPLKIMLGIEQAALPAGIGKNHIVAHQAGIE